MRKFVKNQITGEFRQILHCPEKYGGDRWKFDARPYRCSRNDEYEYDQPRLNKGTYVCKSCAFVARRRKGVTDPPTCPTCKTEMAYWGMRVRVPSKKKLKKQLGIK